MTDMSIDPWAPTSSRRGGYGGRCSTRSVSTRRRAIARAKGTLRLVAQTRTSSELDARDGQLWATVRRLPNRQGQLAALVYVEGLTLANAADVLGIAVPTAKTHLARARARLAHDLASWREGPPDADPDASTPQEENR